MGLTEVTGGAGVTMATDLKRPPELDELVQSGMKSMTIFLTFKCYQPARLEEEYEELHLQNHSLRLLPYGGWAGGKGAPNIPSYPSVHKGSHTVYSYHM